MYRLLNQADEVRERRDQARRPSYSKPVLLATGPNQVWSWDITKLAGPGKWLHYNLYVILDIFSRYVVGWMVADAESSELAQDLIKTTATRQSVDRGQLTIHSDRGPSMTSLGVAELLARLEITKSHSRPYCSNDNPFSESQFKTLKYNPTFPERFGSLEDAKEYCRWFFQWYNNDHYHSRLALMTPKMMHYGEVEAVVKRRQEVLDQAYQAHPQRFSKAPEAKRPPEKAWINPPPTPSPSEQEPEQETGKAQQEGSDDESINAK